MKLNPEFNIVEVADEFMAVPIGTKASSFHGIIALSEATAYLLKNMSVPKTKEDLLKLLIDEYEVDYNVASLDLERIIAKLTELELIIE